MVITAVIMAVITEITAFTLLIITRIMRDRSIITHRDRRFIRHTMFTITNRSTISLTTDSIPPITRTITITMTTIIRMIIRMITIETLARKTRRRRKVDNSHRRICQRLHRKGEATSIRGTGRLPSRTEGDATRRRLMK